MKPSARDLLDWGLLGLAALWLVGPATLLDPDLALGRHTRDLFDHVALLDVWSTRVEGWAFLVSEDAHERLTRALDQVAEPVR